MKFKLGKSKITNFFCHKNFQGKTKTGKFGKTLANFRHISGMYTGKTKNSPFFCLKIFLEKKTLENLAKHWKILDRLVEFTLKNRNFLPFFFVTKISGKIKN
jgi:hypothetical protein